MRHAGKALKTHRGSAPQLRAREGKNVQYNALARHRKGDKRAPGHLVLLLAMAAEPLHPRWLHRDGVLGPDEFLHAALSATPGHRPWRRGNVDRRDGGHLGCPRHSVPAVLGTTGGSLLLQ